MSDRVAYRTCPLCEATCGLEVTVRDDVPVRVRPDHEDVFSKGFVCPKGASLLELHDDPDRVRVPLLKQADGSFAEASWDEAFAVIAEKLPALIDEHGRDSVAVYLGNPSAHSLGSVIYGRALIKAVGTKNVYSASTVDQYPKQLAAAMMFGSGLAVPVPDLDRTDFLLMLGANPLASNGSLMTVPDARGRLRAIQARGGKLVVVDPRRTRTAQLADEHLFIRPGTDSLLLFALAQVIFSEGLVDLGSVAELVAGLDEVRALAEEFTPDAVAPVCGIPADVITRLARELAAAESAAVYGRIGTTTTSFGAVASWLVDVLNVITGNLDKPGGAMFTQPAHGGPTVSGEPGRGRGGRFGRYVSRVRGAREVFGEFPAACLAEEIETPGEGQIRALITNAGNPAVSTPNSTRLAAALETLDFMVSVDIYVNETTRHADVILPSPSPLEKAHFDIPFYEFSVRDVANWSGPVVERPAGMLDEWQTLLRLCGVVGGAGADPDVAGIDRFIALSLVQRECGDAHSVASGLDPDAVMSALEPRDGPERIVDLMLRCGPYGEGFPALGAPGPGSLSLGALQDAPHGLDFGALKPRLPGALRTRTGMIELAPPDLVADVERLSTRLAAGTNGNGMLLVGRRDLRSNNSWMHNLPKLVSGPERCTVWVHPDDAERLGLVDGEPARVSARAGAIELPVQVTDDVMAGVISIPHGWGHGGDGVELRVAAEHAGANSNILADELDLEPLSGTAVLNGIPVSVAPVREAVAAAG